MRLKTRVLLLGAIMLSSFGGMFSFMNAFGEFFGGNIPSPFAPPAFFMVLITFLSTFMFFFEFIKFPRGEENGD